jgi:hypothetical protein
LIEVDFVDVGLPIRSIAAKTAEEAKVENPLAWLVCTTENDRILESPEIVDGGIYHLRSTVRIEKEGKTACFNLHEDEGPCQLRHRVHRSLGTNPDQWDKGACPVRATRARPVQPTTPLGPDQVNVLLFDQWDLLDVRGSRLSVGHRLSAGGRFLIVERAEPVECHMGPKTVKVQ